MTTETKRKPLTTMSNRDELRDVWEEYDRQAWEAYKSLVGREYATPEEFRDSYHGRWDSEREFTENLVDDLGLLREMPENMRWYFDYEAFSRDLFMSDYSYMEGYVFSNH